MQRSNFPYQDFRGSMLGRAALYPHSPPRPTDRRIVGGWLACSTLQARNTQIGLTASRTQLSTSHNTFLHKILELVHIILQTQTTIDSYNSLKMQQNQCASKTDD
eukprot:TRINITY_DN17388_c0_g1_i1.p2 TRINITY_DN17388_c0_g1~~TRINITY_DN17388_c0_g1_i1.p2  ORF type:complete len:105 (+),score=3.02 TRINITY_DN17388_c0_g1_i1:108-422(+)